MNDLIEREKTLKRLLAMADQTGLITTESVEYVIASEPSAQPEIIKCKDCLVHGICRFEQGLGLDGYCSKKEGEHDESD